MVKSIALNFSIKRVPVGSLVRFNGDFYYRGRSVRGCDVIRLDSVCSNRCIYVGNLTPVQYYKSN